jgi:RNA polymerase sigma factor (sigma-70 family)
LVRASTRPAENDDLPAPDFPGSPDTQPDSICVRAQFRNLLTVAAKALPERHQQVVMLYYAKELNMREIAQVLGVNENRVSQIHKVSLKKMVTVLHESGVDSAHAF